MTYVTKLRTLCDEVFHCKISKHFAQLKPSYLNNHYVDHSNAFHTFIVQVGEKCYTTYPNIVYCTGEKCYTTTPILLIMHCCVSSLHQPHQPHLFMLMLVSKYSLFEKSDS